MSGPIALHGGGEFLAGDEPFLRALLDAASGSADGRAGQAEPIRVVLMPTAAARQAPDAAARMGTRAFERLAGDFARPVHIETARVVDPASADDPAAAERLEAADLIYLPGGDPDVIPELLPALRASRAWRAIDVARSRGAVLAGASAGAMALCQLTWTPGGVLAGLGLVRGLVVFPHADADMWSRQTMWFTLAEAAGLGVLGIGERTGLISVGPAIGHADEPSLDGGTAPWLVIGQREVRWLPPGAVEPAVLVDGQTLDLPA